MHPVDEFRLEVRVKRIGPHSPALPRYQSAGAAGMNIRAALEAPVELAPLARMKVPTGLTFAIPQGFEGQVRPRSGLAARHGITVLNSPGTIDSDYRGEVEVLLVNLGSESFVIAPGDRIAQIVFARCEMAILREVLTLDETERGSGGYGSTGV